MSNAKIIVSISGPSTVGKTKTIKALCRMKNQYRRVISNTSRLQREDETEGVDYNFISKSEFIHKMKNESFVYWKKNLYGFYGLDQISLENVLNEGDIPVLDIDVDALIELKRKEYKIVSFFLIPQSMEIIRLRLYSRGPERGILTEYDAEVRFQEAIKMVDYIALYDYVLVNHNDTNTANTISQIIQIELIKQSKHELISKLRQEVFQYKLVE